MAQRVARSLRHSIQAIAGFILMLPLILAFSFAFAQTITLGLCSSNSAVGLPRRFLRWRRLPYVLPIVLLVDLPLALLWTTSLIFEFGLLKPAALVAFEVCTIFRQKRSPNARLLPASDAPDAEAGPRAPPRSNGACREQSAPAAKDGARYRQHASIWAALEGDGDKVLPGDVRLISLKWLMALAESGGVLPRRQDLPEEAFLSPAQLRRIEESARLGFDGVGFFDAVNRVLKEPGVSSFVSFVLSIFRRKRNPDALLPIISVSYCWLEAAHPDREGRQLQLLCRKLRSLYGGRGLHGACYEYGFSDMGVFLDWCSGYQKDPALFAETRAYGESRSGEEKAAFGRMLENTMVSPPRAQRQHSLFRPWPIGFRTSGMRMPRSRLY